MRSGFGRGLPHPKFLRACFFTARALLVEHARPGNGASVEGDTSEKPLALLLDVEATVCLQRRQFRRSSSPEACSRVSTDSSGHAVLPLAPLVVPDKVGALGSVEVQLEQLLVSLKGRIA